MESIIMKKNAFRNSYFVFLCILVSISSEISVEFLRKAKNIYSKVIPCIKLGRENINTSTWEFPLDAESHYQDLIERTRSYRDIEPHVYASYPGPWIENYFISHFINKPLSYFNGLIPLFIQWNDIVMHDYHMKRNPRYFSLTPHIRPNVLYFTVTQYDDGFGVMQQKLPNILVFSAGGYGNIPIPLIKGEVPLSNHTNLSDFLYDTGFYGNQWTHPFRKHLLTAVEQQVKAQGLTHKFAASTNWQEDMRVTKFNLAPRGNGRTSFRITETIHMGRIPVYLFAGLPWTPYEGHHIDYSHIGLVATKTNISELVTAMKRFKDDSSYLEEMHDRVRQARPFYTYEGVLRQIELFLADPLGPDGGYLRCTMLPDKFNKWNSFIEKNNSRN